jgi:hypothetical protein
MPEKSIQSIIDKTAEILSKLPIEKAEEISDFALFVLNRYEEDSLKTGIKKLVEESKSFDFLNNEEDIYSLSDIKNLS